MSGLPTERALQIIRAFGYFSHLANIAEDQHQIRRTRADAKARPRRRRARWPMRLDARAEAGISARAAAGFFDNALVQPGADRASDRGPPQELDRPRDGDRPAAGRARPRPSSRPRSWRTTDDALRRAVLTLWQTSLMRGTRLRVIDEVANGLAYYDHTFLRALPAFYADLEDRLGAADPAWQDIDVPSFLRMGSWIGGDRDGNPFVTAEVSREALALQSQRALRFYLDELHLLGGELSLDGRIVHRLRRACGAGRALARPTRPSARTSPTGAPSSASTRGSPPRRWRWTASRRRCRRSGRRRAYEDRRRLQAPISTRSHSRCAENGSARPGARTPAVAPPRRRRVRLSSRCRSTCGRTPTCIERVMAELLETAGVGADYADARRGGARRACCRRTGQSAAAGVAQFLLWRGNRRRARDAAGGGGCASPLRPRRHAQLRHLQGRRRLRHPGSRRAAEGSRPPAPARGPARRRHRAAVRDHRRPAALRPDHGRSSRPARLPPPARLARRHPGGDARLFRQQQGRRLPDLDLGAVQGRAGADRDLPAPQVGLRLFHGRGGSVGRGGGPELRGDPGAADRRRAGRASASPSRAR